MVCLFYCVLERARLKPSRTLSTSVGSTDLLGCSLVKDRSNREFFTEEPPYLLSGSSAEFRELALIWSRLVESLTLAGLLAEGVLTALVVSSRAYRRFFVFFGDIHHVMLLSDPIKRCGQIIILSS